MKERKSPLANAPMRIRALRDSAIDVRPDGGVGFQGQTGLGGKDLSLWTTAYPSGFQPYRQSHFNIDEWVTAGYDKKFITAPAHNGVRLAAADLQDIPDLFQRQISGMMTIGVIDGFKTIEIDHHKGETRGDIHH